MSVIATCPFCDAELEIPIAVTVQASTVNTAGVVLDVSTELTPAARDVITQHAAEHDQ